MRSLLKRLSTHSPLAVALVTLNAVAFCVGLVFFWDDISIWLGRVVTPPDVEYCQCKAIVWTRLKTATYVANTFFWIAIAIAVFGSFRLVMWAWGRGQRTQRLPQECNQPPQQSLLLRQALAVFALLDLLVPTRISKEESGDALEVILRMLGERCPTWRIYLKIATTIVCVLAHAAYGALFGVAKTRGG